MIDYVLRGLTDDGAFRVVALQATATAQGAVHAQKCSGPRARLLSEMLVGTILVRETMSPGLRVQGILQGNDRKSRIIADSLPDGSSRALLQVAPDRELELGEHAMLQMMRTLQNGELGQGLVSANVNGGMSGALMQYMQASEQVVSFIAVGAVVSGDVVQAAGGYIVQLLPGAPEGPLMVMTERLRAFESIDALLASGGADPAVLLGEVLYGMEWSEVGRSEVCFACHCSEERLVASLSSLPKHDIAELLEGGAPLDIDCDYCGKHYCFAPERLRGLVAAN